RRHDGCTEWMPDAGEPGANGVLDLAQGAAAGGTAGPADAREQHASHPEEYYVGCPHRPERGDLARLRERLARDEPNIIEAEHAETHTDDEADTAPGGPARG